MKNNRYRQAEYLLSAHTLDQIPPDQGAEVAFAGRSNAGKSSVINTITDRKSLARVSKTPGRTRQINFFQVQEDIRLVDLPGYGFAKVSDALQQHWGRTLSAYFEKRTSLKGLILITDIRRLLTDYDEQMLAWCQANGLPVHVLLNKADKLSFGASKQSLIRVRQKLANESLSVQLYSALKKAGVDEVRARLDTWLFD